MKNGAGPMRTSRHSRFRNFYELEQEYFRVRAELAELKRELHGERRVTAAYKELIHRSVPGATDIPGQLALFEGIVVAAADISTEEWEEYLANKKAGEGEANLLA